MNICQNVCHHEKRTDLKVGHVGSGTMSVGQNLEKSCVLFSKHNFDPVCMKLCQNVSQCGTMLCWIKLKLGQIRSKSRSFDEILEKPFLFSEGLKVLFQSL